MSADGLDQPHELRTGDRLHHEHRHGVFDCGARRSVIENAPAIGRQSSGEHPDIVVRVTRIVDLGTAVQTYVIREIAKILYRPHRRGVGKNPGDLVLLQQLERLLRWATSETRKPAP